MAATFEVGQRQMKEKARTERLGINTVVRKGEESGEKRSFCAVALVQPDDTFADTV